MKLLSFVEAPAKPTRLWSRAWLSRRETLKFGACSFVSIVLKIEDIASFQNYLRLTIQQFDKLYKLVRKHIDKKDTILRQSIPGSHRLMVTLRYVATGETFKSLGYCTRMAACTISKFVPEVLRAIYDCLQDTYLKVPNTPWQWQQVAAEYYKIWNVPNCIAAIDGKHIAFRPPRSAGSHYYNYKGWHSTILLAMADAKYRFLYIDVGTNRRVSDGGVYEYSDFSFKLNNETLNLLPQTPLPSMRDPMPYMVLADAAFPFQEHILKPFPFKNMARQERIFNYRLSRGRSVVEYSFGIMANRFRILLDTINLSRDKTVLITHACCVLHNFLIDESGNYKNGVDHEQNNGDIENGIWRQDASNIQSITVNRGRPNVRRLNIRNEFKLYFNTCGTVPWQDSKI